VRVSLSRIAPSPFLLTLQQKRRGLLGPITLLLTMFASGQSEGLPSSLPHPPLSLPQASLAKIVPDLHADSSVAKLHIQAVDSARR
jgi:hypothetical protein